jgi:nicotinate phosphoribosyltransferase
MMQAVLHHYPAVDVEYTFKCRDQNVDLAPLMTQVEREIDDLCQLRFHPMELHFLSKWPFFKPDFVQFLKNFQLDKDYVKINHGTKFKIRGPWLHTILFETPSLAIVSQLHSDAANTSSHYYKVAQQRLDEKIAMIKELGFLLFFADFGTRRRHSFHWQESVIDYLKKQLPNQFVGTSNVYFAMKFGIKPIGTMAHEWLQAHQQLGVRVKDSQKAALDAWAREYRGDLGIALTDVIGIDAFLQDFDMFFAKLFDGVRHDSGDPFEFGHKVIKHYESMNIDPTTKTIVFSDGLNFPKMIDLHKEFSKYIKVSFGIGTNLMHDFVRKALNIVMKMTMCNGSPVAKISDSPGKNMCEDAAYVEYLKKVYGVTWA